MDPIFLVLAALVSGFVGFFAAQSRSAILRKNLLDSEKRVRELEKESHVQEMKKLEEINKSKLEHFELIKLERDKAYAEGSAKTRAEIELNQKSIAVSMRPYIKTVTDKGILKDTYRADAGYIYQLMVNGVPALSPHIVIERSEEWAEINEERMKAIENTALKLTEVAIQTYLGNAGSALVFKRDALISN